MCVAGWLTDILVESSTGTRPSVTGLSDVTRMSIVQWVTTREIPLGCIKATRYTAILLISLQTGPPLSISMESPCLSRVYSVNRYSSIEVGSLSCIHYCSIFMLCHLQTWSALIIMLVENKSARLSFLYYLESLGGIGVNTFGHQ